MSKVITVTNQKGGVGKTTTSINVAFYLAKSGKRTLLIDFDPQGNASSGLGVSKEDLEHTISDVLLGTIDANQAICKTDFKHLDLIPSTPQLADIEVKIANAQNRFILLRSAIKSISDNYDYVIIDSPPSLSLLTVNSMIAANYILLPVQTEFYALEGVAQLLETMKLVKKVANPNLSILGVLATMYDKRTSLSSQVLAEIKKYFKELTFKTTIPRNIRLAEAPSHGAPIGKYDAFSRGAKAYKQLTQEILELTK